MKIIALKFNAYHSYRFRKPHRYLCIFLFIICDGAGHDNLQIGPECMQFQRFPQDSHRFQSD